MKRGDRRPYGTEFAVLNGANVNWQGKLTAGETIYGWSGILWPTREQAEEETLRLAHSMSLWAAVMALLIAAAMAWTIATGTADFFGTGGGIGAAAFLIWLSIWAERAPSKGLAIDEYRVIHGGRISGRLKRLETTIYQGGGTSI